jgi:hypothetical protein
MQCRCFSGEREVRSIISARNPVILFLRVHCRAGMEEAGEKMKGGQ